MILKDTANWGNGIPGLTGQEVCIVLTRGCLSLIDAEDAEELSRVKWRSMAGRHQVRAVRTTPRDEQCKQQTILMHRHISKPLPDQEVDHRDQHIHFDYKVVDNRRQNLRNVTKSQNHANQRKMLGSSCYKGVSWYKRYEKWMSQITVNRRRIYLGLFTSQLEAAHAYNQAHEQHFPGIQEGLNRTMFQDAVK